MTTMMRNMHMTDGLQGKVLITGGAGTLGSAIIKRATEEDWDCDITIYSTDAVKHARVKKMYPRVQSIIGDIRQFDTLFAAMSGKDLVIHGGAVKIIPDSEYHSIDTFGVNVEGSQNVALAAGQLGVPDVLAISTDKACHAANAYGASKYMMEKVWQEYSRYGWPTRYHLVRYGNVIESTASVVEAWRRAAAAGEEVHITDPKMTRFWLSPSQAVQYVLDSLECDSGQIYVPKMPSLSIGKLLEYVVGERYFNTKTIPLRPGEKMHETLVTEEEMDFAESVEEEMDFDRIDSYFIIHPTTDERFASRTEEMLHPYTSDRARELTREGLEELLKG